VIPADPLREAVAARALETLLSGPTREAAAAVAGAGGGAVRGLLFFGSRRTGAAPDPWSAHDFFVMTSAAIPFYRALRAAGQTHRQPLLLALLEHWMPPNQIPVWSRRSEEGNEGLAKCAVLRLDRLRRETSPRRHDHFCAGRLFQPTAVAYAADASAREALVDAMTSAHRETYRWVRPWLPPRFDSESYCRTLLTVSMRYEIRPEPRGRAEALWAAQREEQLRVYPLLLAELLARGELVEPEPGVFALARPVGAWERLRLLLYFNRSRARATLRWFKYTATFEGWLDYILRKMQRHTGRRIEVSERERRLPLLLLWGKFYRAWRGRDHTPRPPGKEPR
jgi:hypothetical protein